VRRADQIALVRGREGRAVAGEEPDLGPGPGILGVEEEPVVVEDGGGKRRSQADDRTVGAVADRMSDAEALMWTLEKDPHLSSTFANLTLLDRAPDVDALRSRLELATVRVPRLRRRVVAGLGRMAPPEWRPADVDLDWHVRRVALPAPGTERDLLDLTATLAAEPFDRTRPLWRFTVVEGLEGGRAAFVQQLHHTVSDGEGAVRISAEVLDFEREAPPPEAVELPPAAVDAGDGFLGVAKDSFGHLGRRSFGIARRTAGGSVELLRHPGKLSGLGQRTGVTARSVVRQVAVADPARSPLWTERTLRRRLDVLRVPLDDVRRTAKALGGSVNDVFVTAVAGGAGDYHRARGVEVDELRMAMPISTRDDRSAGGNAFMPTRSLVSTVADPRARFAAITERLAVTKTEPALRLVQSVAGITNLLPTSVLVRAARQQVETVDFTTSNVRGAPFDLYIAGAHIEANYPLGPLAGTAFNATLLSVAGSLDIGVHSDTGAVEDGAALRDAISASFDELLSL
jgi:diacylglycerol O-acyltransferase / wax synthase